MRERDIRRLEAEDLSVTAALIPGKKPAPPRRGLVLGLDVEWDTPTNAMVTAQLSAMVDGKAVARVYDVSRPRISIESLAELVDRFVQELQLEVPAGGRTRVYLVAHFAQAELSMLEDPLLNTDVDSLGKATFATLRDVVVGERTWELRLVDLFAVYQTSLAKIGDSLGIPKVIIPDGSILKMADFRRSNRQLYDEYACRDAVIAVTAFTDLRSQMLDTWGVDPLAYRTVASLSLAIFKYGFMGDASPVPFRTIVDSFGRSRPVVKYPALRRLALQAYWGGRNEAYVRGLYRGPVVDLDVSAMYPHAALLQPLPTATTAWKSWCAKGSKSPPPSKEKLLSMEGFVHVEFTFPKDCRYPCLPAVHAEVAKLYFPLRGTSFCTIAELRAAADLGATWRLLSVWAFVPTDAEKNHSLVGFVRHFLDLKNKSVPGSFEYATAKLLLNALFGKFAERVESDLTTKVERHGRIHGAPGLAAVFARSARMRGALKGRMRVGTGWAPEWAALILGRARAVMASIVVSTNALLISTDGVVAPATDTGYDTCHGVRELRSVGSDLMLKDSGDALWTARERLYAVLRGGKIVKLARHGMPGSEAEATADVLACIVAGKDVARARTRNRLASPKEAARRDVAVNSTVTETRTARFTWDAKRRLLDRDACPFTSISDTGPYATLGHAMKGERQRRGRPRSIKESLQDKKAAPELAAEALAMISSGDMTVSEIAAKVKVPVKVIRKLQRTLTRKVPPFQAGTRDAPPSTRRER